MLKLKNIVKDYVSGDTVVKALKGIDIQFRENEFVSVLGPSGCGKTTLLNIIGGLDRYTEGDLVINGRDLMTLGYRQGKEIGDALKMLLDEVIIKPELNTRLYLMKRAKEIKGRLR